MGGRDVLDARSSSSGLCQSVMWGMQTADIDQKGSGRRGEGEMGSNTGFLEGRAVVDYQKLGQ